MEQKNFLFFFGFVFVFVVVVLKRFGPFRYIEQNSCYKFDNVLVAIKTPLIYNDYCQIFHFFCNALTGMNITKSPFSPLSLFYSSKFTTCLQDPP